jgi:hypothetical protein
VRNPRGDEWIEEIARRRANVQPVRRLLNSTLFGGTLVKGNRRLNAWQRSGALVIGLFFLTFGCFGPADLVGALLSWSLAKSELYVTLFCPVFLWIGWKITINALVNDPRNGLPHKSQ